MKKVAIVQSNYIPWKGYFDLIAAVDEFILYDDVQYTRRDWRNRNQIKTPEGLLWLTVPVVSKPRDEQRIRDVEIADQDWQANHFKSFQHFYKASPYFIAIADRLEPYYNKSYTHLWQLNHDLIRFVCAELHITTRISCSWDYTLSGDKNERLVNLCKQAGASEYLSGPAARDYLDESLFAKYGIDVSWFNYAGYPEYPQLWGAFEHGVSILDLLFNCGKDARRYMKCGL
jgi:hypothetical protein